MNKLGRYATFFFVVIPSLAAAVFVGCYVFVLMGLTLLRMLGVIK